MYKKRNPVAVGVLVFFTLGFYFIYWQYIVNREIINYDERIKSNPFASAGAVLLGYFFLLMFYVGIYSAYSTGERPLE